MARSWNPAPGPIAHWSVDRIRAGAWLTLPMCWERSTTDGQVVWVADQYVDRALLPQTPVPFNVHIPEDLAKNISSQRTVVASYSFEGSI